MYLDENDYQLLGFMEPNGQDLYDTVGNQCSKSPTEIEFKRLIDFNNSNSIKFQ
jgi:hypothetical protein